MKEKSLGSYRFVVLHECVHYDLHKEFLTVRKQLMDLDVECNNSVEMPKAIIDDIIKNDNVYSCESKIEWQANNIAGRVLVPSDMLITELSKKYEEYNYFNSDNKESILRIIASDFAKIFGALKEEMYNADATFRELIDTNKVVYVNNRCIINDDKYYNAGAITFFGRKHPNESMIFFKKNTNYDSYADDELYCVKSTKKLIRRYN